MTSRAVLSNRNSACGPILRTHADRLNHQKELVGDGDLPKGGIDQAVNENLACAAKGWITAPFAVTEVGRCECD